jgi:hypothetical protein
MKIRSRASLFIVLFLSIFFSPGAGITPTEEKKIDVILIVDGSGSMEWPDRDPGRLRIQGGKLFIDLCAKGDRVGLVDFSTDAKIVFPLYEFLTPLDKETLKEKIATIAAKGEFTDITLGLETALKEMIRARPESVKAVIILSDGDMDPDPARDIFSPYNLEYQKEIQLGSGKKETIKLIKEKYKKIAAPIDTELLRNSVLPGFKEQKIPVFAIAFGQGADIPLIKEIADVCATETGIRNFYFIENASRLQSVFSEIVEQLKKSKEKIAEKEIEFSGEEIIHKVNIDDFVREVNFKFIFGRNIISRTTKKEGVGHIFEKGYELYNIFNPLPGTWEARISGKKDVKLDITISTWGRSELKLVSENVKSEYYAGEQIPITASLQIDGKRITSRDFLNNLKISAATENPKREVEKIDLFDDGGHSDTNAADGIFGNSYTTTNIPGDYYVIITAQGMTAGPKRYDFMREIQYKFRILPKETSLGGSIEKQPGKPEKAKSALPIKTILILAGILAIILLAVFLIKKRKAGTTTEDESIDEIPEEKPSEAPLMFSIKIKDGAVSTIGYKMIRHPSIGEKNLILRRAGEEFYIQRSEGTLELNTKIVMDERELKDRDILKIGELYFETNLKPVENKVILYGISKEQASLAKKEER